jgi:hypothetical protein
MGPGLRRDDNTMRYNISMLNKFLSRGGANIKAALTGSALFGLIVAVIDWRLQLGWFWAFILLIPILTVDIINVAQKVKLNWQADVYRGLALLGCFGLALAGGSAIVPVAFGLYFAGLTSYTLSVRTDGLLKVGKYFVWPLEALVSFFTVLAASAPVFKSMRMNLKGANGSGNSVKLSDKSKSVIRGAIIAAPILLIFGLLLSSSDPIFAKLFDLPFDLPSFDLGGIYKFLLTTVFFGSLVFGAVSVAVRQKREELTIRDNFKFGLTEAKVVGWSIAALFGLFILVQFRYMFLGYTDVIQGYTYSDYARRGFVELIAVSLMSLAVVRYFQTKLSSQTDKLRALNSVIFLEMLVLAGSSLKRLSLYEQAYGLTTLRFFAVTVVLWLIGVWLIHAALSLDVVKQIKDKRLAGYAGIWLGVIVFIYLILNPVSFVLNHNFERYTKTGKLDVCYQLELSGDSAEAAKTYFEGVSSRSLNTETLNDMKTKLLDSNVFAYIPRNCAYIDFKEIEKLTDNGGYELDRSRNLFEHTLRSYLATH